MKLRELYEMLDIPAPTYLTDAELEKDIEQHDPHDPDPADYL